MQWAGCEEYCTSVPKERGTIRTDLHQGKILMMFQTDARRVATEEMDRFQFGGSLPHHRRIAYSDVTFLSACFGMANGTISFGYRLFR
jgi:hypothetical protein